MKLMDSGDQHADPVVQNALRRHYAAPADASYWSTLEQRIMQAVRQERDRQWWSYFPGWVRMGLAAAAAAVVVASIASWQTRVAHERLAYEELLDTPTEIPLLSDVDRDARPRRDRTLRYLLTR